MQIIDLGDGTIKVIETVREINDRAERAGQTPPIGVLRCPPIGQLAICTRMTMEEARHKGVLP